MPIAPKLALRRLLVYAAVWTILVEADPAGLVAGAVVVPVAFGASLLLSPPDGSIGVVALLRHLPRFLAGSLRGGVDVAARAFSRDMRLDPGWTARASGLSHVGQVFFGFELSLMPGTLAAGGHGGRVLVHVLDRGAVASPELAALEDEVAWIAGARGPGAGAR